MILNSSRNTGLFSQQDTNSNDIGLLGDTFARIKELGGLAAAQRYTQQMTSYGSIRPAKRREGAVGRREAQFISGPLQRTGMLGASPGSAPPAMINPQSLPGGLNVNGLFTRRMIR